METGHKFEGTNYLASLIAPKSTLGSFSRPNKEFLLLQYKNSQVL
jgi:hypothetical protein